MHVSLLVLSSLLWALTCSAKKRPALVSFGDSFSMTNTDSDGGGQNLRGKIQSSTFGGPAWTEWLTGCIAGDTKECKIDLYPFARRNAAIVAPYRTVGFDDPEYEEVSHSMGSQLTDFVSRPSKFHDSIDKERTIASLWFGLNEVIAARDQQKADPGFDVERAYRKALHVLFENGVQRLVDAGYRNILLMNNIPADRSPGNAFRVSQGRKAVPSKADLDMWTKLLHEGAAGWTEAKVMVFDVNQVLNGILDQPADWSIEVTKYYCECQDQDHIYLRQRCFRLFRAMDNVQFFEQKPRTTKCVQGYKYFWYDDIHPQATVQKIIALRVSEFLQKELGPDFFPEWPAPDEKSIKDNVKEWSFGTWP